MKASVPKYGNRKLHENSARHKAVMDAIEQKTSENAMPKHISRSVTPTHIRIDVPLGRIDVGHSPYPLVVLDHLTHRWIGFKCVRNLRVRCLPVRSGSGGGQHLRMWWWQWWTMCCDSGDNGWASFLSRLLHCAGV